MEKTVNKPKTNAEGFDLILTHFGPSHGAVTKFGEALDPQVSRQTVHRWKSHGIPTKYWPQINALTGLKPHQYQPENF